MTPAWKLWHPLSLSLHAEAADVDNRERRVKKEKPASVKNDSENNKRWMFSANVSW